MKGGFLANLSGSGLLELQGGESSKNSGGGKAGDSFSSKAATGGRQREGRAKPSRQVHGGRAPSGVQREVWPDAVWC